MKIPIKIYERLTNTLTSDFCTNLAMRIQSDVELVNIDGSLYAVYTIKN